MYKFSVLICVNGLFALKAVAFNKQFQFGRRKRLFSVAVNGAARNGDVGVSRGGFRGNFRNFAVIGGLNQVNLSSGAHTLHDHFIGTVVMIVYVFNRDVCGQVIRRTARHGEFHKRGSKRFTRGQPCHGVAVCQGDHICTGGAFKIFRCNNIAVFVFQK